MARHKDEELHERRRRQILEAASRVFRRKGFHATRTEEICREAGLSAGTVFRYFAGKDEIIAAITEWETARDRQEVRTLGTRQGLEWLARMTPEDFLELMAPTPYDLGLDSWLELVRNPRLRDRLQHEDEVLRLELAERIRKGQQEGWIRADLPAEGAAHFLFALFEGLKADQQLTPHWDPAAVSQAVAMYFRHCVLAQSGPPTQS